MIEEKYISMRGYKDITRKTFMGKILMAKNQLLSREITSGPIYVVHTIIFESNPYAFDMILIS